MHITINVTDEENDEYSFSASFSAGLESGEQTIQTIDRFLGVVRLHEENLYLYQHSDDETAEEADDKFEAQENANRWQWTVDQMTQNITLKDVDPNANQG